jgi:hypothetical protein
VIYEGAGHGFMRTAAYPNASGADRKAFEQARERVRAILSEL